MGIHRGPNIVKDNLVFGYDTGYGVADNSNTTRFYPGENTTNVVTNRLPTTGWNTANAQGSSITRTFLTENGIPFMRFSNVTNGNDYPRVTDSTFYNSTTVTGTFSTSLEVRGTVGASLRFRIYQNGSTKITNTVTLTSDWVRYTFDNQTTSFNLNQPYFNPVTTGATYDIRNIQIESKSHTTPFVDGTRSDTASIIDLKKTTDIDVSNISFDTTGQPDFDGTDDIITQSRIIDTASYSAEFVFKADVNTSGTEHWLGSQYPGTGRVIFDLYTNNRLRNFINGTSINGATTIATGNWYHAVFTRNSLGVAYIYLNGVQDATGTISTSTPVNDPFDIGGSTTLTRWFNGNIAVVKIYNTDLTAAQAAQNYNAYKNRFNI